MAHFFSFHNLSNDLELVTFFVLSCWDESFSYYREKVLSITFNYYLRECPQNNFTDILRYSIILP